LKPAATRPVFCWADANRRSWNFEKRRALSWQNRSFVMRQKLALLTVAYVAISAILLVLAYHPQGPVTTQKTDRVAGASTGSHFLVERFAG
jgi:hypothetical protein